MDGDAAIKSLIRSLSQRLPLVSLSSIVFPSFPCNALEAQLSHDSDLSQGKGYSSVLSFLRALLDDSVQREKARQNKLLIDYVNAMWACHV